MPKGYSAYNQGGWHHSEEAKEKIGQASISRFSSKEMKLLVGKRTKEALASPEMRLFISKQSKAGITPEDRAHRSELGKLKIGKLNPSYGRPVSLETRAKISASESEEKHYNWKGGISKEPYPMLDNKKRERIKTRDNHRCQICAILEVECTRQLSIHHINYNRQDESDDNLISLCVSCHMKTNHNKGYWQALLTSLSNLRPKGGDETCLWR